MNGSGIASVRRCVHVFATFGAGGPQIRALQLMRAMGPGWRHVVMAMDGCTDAHAQLPVDVACELVPPPPRAGFLATRGAQLRWLRDVRPDLVLTYNWGAIESVAAATRLRLPLVHHEDGFLPDEQQRRLRRRSWLRRFLLRATPVIVPSQVLQRIATSEWRLRAANVHHFPNGVDLARFRPSSAQRERVVGTVGGLRPEKDHATLLAALARLGADVRARLVGGGPLLDELRGAAARLGVAARVEFAGAVTDTAPCYAGFAVFVLSSRTEQMPLVLLEAMASALPVVATDVGDVRAILPAEAAACVVPAGDDVALANALARVLGDHALAAQLGAANRRRVEERYDARTCLQRFAALYEATARR
jgi:glycosyltransferase involved in cell wall biosynthesis